MVSRDRQWRCELRPTGWRVERHGGCVLEKATLDRMVEFLIGYGVDPAIDLIES